jgi:putative Ca2+/H+ antiporter (TMEM165/GDT1 family)
MTAFIASFMFVFLAEMGDKTQLLAMAFAARYSAYKVLIAVLLATILLNAIAVVAGSLLTTIVPMYIISLLASLSFIVFGLWILRGEKSRNESSKTSKFGPILTVATAFFLAELGDKTQLATISLAVKYRQALGVLAGSTLAMLSANVIGVALGAAINRYIPERAVKIFSAVIFILFGLIGAYRVLAGASI